MNESSQKKISFHGQLHLSDQDTSQCAVDINYEQYNPASLSVSLLWTGSDEEKRKANSYFRSLPYNYVWLSSLDQDHPPIELLGISAITSRHHLGSLRASEITVSAFQSGITKIPLEKDTELHIHVRLQPSGILILPHMANHNHNGCIEINRLLDGDVELPTKYGTLKALNVYEYDKSSQFGDEVTQKIQRTSIMGNIKIPRGESLYDAHENLTKELAFVCSVLSFCYRQKIDYYEIEYLNTENKNMPRQIYRRHWDSSKSRISVDELIGTQGLINGGLSKLISSVDCNKFSDDIVRAMSFLASSYEAPVETAYFMSFSAMETIVSCCADSFGDLRFGSSAWRKIENSIRNSLPNDLTEKQLKSITDKLPELKRPSLITKINVACDTLSPKISDLWPDSSFTEGMTGAIGIRNGLFHSSSPSGDTIHLYRELVRVRTFSERLLLKILNWPDAEIWPHYDQELKRTRSL